MSIKSVYDELAKNRQSYEDRAELSAEVTSPSLFPIDNFSANDGYKSNYVQALGSSGVNALASKLVFSLMPPQGRFFRMSPDSAALGEITGGSADAKAQVYATLSQGEERVLKEIEAQKIRTKFYEVLKYLIVSGNVLIEKIEGKGIKTHSLRNYVVRRGTDNEVVKIILKEVIDSANPPEALEALVNPENKEDKFLYTMYEFVEKKWVRTQEFEDDVVGIEKTWSDVTKLPVKVLGWSFLNNEDFARSYIDEFVGFLVQYNKQTEILLEGAFAQAKIVYTVNPLGVTRKKDLDSAGHLDIIDGKADDVATIQSNKNFDMQPLMGMREETKRDIGKKFLDNGSVQRDAERVTAEEIQTMSRELETTLAGSFSLLSVDLLLTIVRWIMIEVDIEDMGDDVEITVGLDALSRNRQAELLMQYVSAVHNLQYQDYLNEGEIVQRLATFMGVNSVDLNLTPNQVQQKRTQAAQAAQAQQMSMSGADTVGKQAVQQGEQ